MLIILREDGSLRGAVVFLCSAEGLRITILSGGTAGFTFFAKRQKVPLL